MQASPTLTKQRNDSLSSGGDLATYRLKLEWATFLTRAKKAVSSGELNLKTMAERLTESSEFSPRGEWRRNLRTRVAGRQALGDGSRARATSRYHKTNAAAPASPASSQINITARARLRPRRVN